MHELPAQQWWNEKDVVLPEVALLSHVRYPYPGAYVHAPPTWMQVPPLFQLPPSERSQPTSS